MAISKSSHPRKGVMQREMSSLIALWQWPLVLGLLTASGLVSALVSDGAGDVWSWFALGVPVAVMSGFAFARRPRRQAP